MPADSVDMAFSPRPWPIVTDAVLSMGINAGATQLLKSSVTRTRPNGSDNNSFISRHTSYAFAATSLVAHETYRYSGFWTVGMHTASNVIAAQRLTTQHHWPSDVAGGVIVGLVSGEAGYWLSRLITGQYDGPLPAVDGRWRQSLDASSGVLFTIGSNHYITYEMGYQATLRYTRPLSEHFGFTGLVKFTSYRCNDGRHHYDESSFGLAIGAVYRTLLPVPRFSFEGRLMAGCDDNYWEWWNVPAYSFTLYGSGGLYAAITPRFSVGADLQAGFRTIGQPSLNLGLALITRASF